MKRGLCSREIAIKSRKAGFTVEKAPPRDNSNEWNVENEK